MGFGDGVDDGRQHTFGHLRDHDVVALGEPRSARSSFLGAGGKAMGIGPVGQDGVCMANADPVRAWVAPRRVSAAQQRARAQVAELPRGPPWVPPLWPPPSSTIGRSLPGISDRVQPARK